MGEGIIKKVITLNGKRIHLVFCSAIHTSELAANLMSISCFNAAGFSIIFGKRKATLLDPSGLVFMEGIGSGGIYLLDASNNVSVMVAHSHDKPTSLEVWHCQFGPTGVTAICTMARKQLVDGFYIEGDLDLKGICKDCVYGKHTAHLYDETVVAKKDVLERVHIDLWGPSLVRSNGGVLYMMLLVDNDSSHMHPILLLNKSVATTLDAFKVTNQWRNCKLGRKSKE